MSTVFLQQLALNQVTGALIDAVSDKELLGGLNLTQVAATQAFVSGDVMAARARSIGSLRDAGVRAEDAATLVAQSQWLGGVGFTHVNAFAAFSNAGPDWATNSAWVDTMLARFAGQNLEEKWAFPLSTTAESITQTIAGTHDAIILSMAQRICAGAPSAARYIDFRPGWEPNFSTSYPWGSTLVTVAQYIAAFRHVADILRSVDPRVRITFCPAFRLDGAWPWTAMYPGDAYVDIIGPDVYCLLDDKTVVGLPADADFTDFIFTSVSGVYAFRDFAVAKGKRLAIPEWGTNYDNPLFIERMAEFIRTNDVEYHAYWDQNNGAFTCKLSGDQWPNSALAFVRNFGPISIDTWGLSAAPGQRLIGTLQANKPIFRAEIAVGNTGGVTIVGSSQITAEPQLSGTRRVTVRAFDSRGQSTTRSICLTWQAGRLWTPADLGANLVDWYAIDVHGLVSRHIQAIKAITSMVGARAATPSTSTLRPTYEISATGVPRASFDGGDAAVQTDMGGVPAAQAAVTYSMQLFTNAAASNFTYIVNDSDAAAGPRAVGYNAGNLRVGASGGYAAGSISADRSIVVSFGAGASAACRGGIDGAAPGTNNVAIGAATYTRRIIGGVSGAANVVGSYYLGALSELFVANVAFSVAQEDFAHGYLAWKYGRESALGGGHAYKTNPPMV